MTNTIEKFREVGLVHLSDAYKDEFHIETGNKQAQWRFEVDEDCDSLCWTRKRNGMMLNVALDMMRRRQVLRMVITDKDDGLYADFKVPVPPLRNLLEVVETVIATFEGLERTGWFD
jgi:hypothetical protein